jgi:hypothetical protein
MGGPEEGVKTLYVTIALVVVPSVIYLALPYASVADLSLLAELYRSLILCLPAMR